MGRVRQTLEWPSGWLVALLAGGALLSAGCGGSEENSADSLWVTVPGLTDATAIAVGAEHACVLGEMGAVWCWGNGAAGQLGDGGMADRDAPVPVAGLDDVRSIAVSTRLSCAIRGDGQVWCWGQGARFVGRGGPSKADTAAGDEGDSDVPVEVPEYEGAIALEGRCAVLASGALMCGATPVQGIDDAVGVAFGTSHTCAVRATGEVDCWGDNTFGQLGNGFAAPGTSPTPQAVVGLADAAAISAGLGHSCAVRKDGTVACWGWGMVGQLGQGEAADALTPTAFGGVDDAVAIATGDYFTCVLRAEGRVVCSGVVAGISDTGQTLEPLALGGLDDGVAFGAKTAGTIVNLCVVRAGGDVACLQP